MRTLGMIIMSFIIIFCLLAGLFPVAIIFIFLLMLMLIADLIVASRKNSKKEMAELINANKQNDREEIKKQMKIQLKQEAKIKELEKKIR